MKVFHRLSRILAVCLVTVLWLVVARNADRATLADANHLPMLVSNVASLERPTLPRKVRSHGTPQPTPTPQPIPDYTLPAIYDGLPPIISQIPTQQKVVFMTIDDGATRLPIVRNLLVRYHVKASLFLNSMYTNLDPNYFLQLVMAGSVTENHTIDHADLTKLTYNQQVAEICGNADMLQGQFGARPTLFRPPYGNYNNATLLAATACGQKAVVLWHAKANGGSMQYQDGNTGLLPGDIVLVHFRPEFLADFTAFRQAAAAAELQPVLLEGWLVR